MDDPDRSQFGLLPPKYLWEILVPCEWINPHSKRYGGKPQPCTTRHHRVWDKRVRAVSGGLTILKPGTGHWISPRGELFVERVIPVRIMCSAAEIDKIADITAQHYRQEAIMYYRVSENVVIKNYR